MEQRSSIPPPPPHPADGKSPVEGRLLPWNYRALLWALGISFGLQLAFLPCMCFEGTVKMDFAVMFDSVVIVRMLIAVLRKEHGRTWLGYAVLLYTSPVWITILISWLRQL